MSDILSIKKRAVSIKNIGKITKSLETVSAMQLRNTEKHLQGTNEYFKALLYLSRRLASTAKAFSHESELTFSPKKGSKVLFLLISTDRGLVGGQNVLFFSGVSEFIKKADIVEPDFMIFGARGSTFAKLQGNVMKEWNFLNRNETAQLATQEIVTLFKSGLYSHVYLAYNEFITMHNIGPIIEQFLPLHFPKLSGLEKEIVEPSFERVLTQVTEMYLSYVLKHAFLEAEASEHASRTIAMKSATDNANEISKELSQKYNTARQEAVTEEILEGAFHHG